jgi:hypothetical protein
MRRRLPAGARLAALVLVPAVLGLMAAVPARADGWHHGPDHRGWRHDRGGHGWHRGPWGRPGYYPPPPPPPPPVRYGPPPGWGYRNYGPPPPPVVYAPPPPLGGIGLFFNFR